MNRISWSQFDLARKLAERAKSIDPVSGYADMVVALTDFYQAKNDKVVERLSKYLELHPPFWWGLWYLWRTLNIMDRKNEAVEAFKKSFIAIGMNDIVQAKDNAGVDNAFGTAAEIMAEIYKQHYLSPYNIAILFSHAGKKEESLHWIEESVKVVDPKLHFINVEPEWQSLRNDERFIRCLKTIGFIK